MSNERNSHRIVLFAVAVIIAIVAAFGDMIVMRFADDTNGRRPAGPTPAGLASDPVAGVA